MAHRAHRGRRGGASRSEAGKAGEISRGKGQQSLEKAAYGEAVAIPSPPRHFAESHPPAGAANHGTGDLFVKTKLCKFHALGVCSKGQDCQFAHTQTEMQPLPDLFRTKLCKTLINTGACEDSTCKYAHNKDQLRSGHPYTRPIWNKQRERDEVADSPNLMVRGQSAPSTSQNDVPASTQVMQGMSLMMPAPQGAQGVQQLMTGMPRWDMRPLPNGGYAVMFPQVAPIKPQADDDCMKFANQGGADKHVSQETTSRNRRATRNKRLDRQAVNANFNSFDDEDKNVTPSEFSSHSSDTREPDDGASSPTTPPPECARRDRTSSSPHSHHAAVAALSEKLAAHEVGITVSLKNTFLEFQTPGMHTSAMRKVHTAAASLCFLDEDNRRNNELF